MSLYIVIEGVDGSGKTLQAERLTKKIRESFECELLALTEPQKAPGTVGSEIRRRLKEGPKLESWEAIGLFVADRIQQFKSTLAPALERGSIVVQDRNWLSTCVYQGDWVGEKTDQAWTPPLNAWLFDHHVSIMPPIDLLILLDVDPKTAARRLSSRSAKSDQFDQDGQLAERCRRYRELVSDGRGPHGAKAWGRSLVVNGDGPAEEVANTIWLFTRTLLLSSGYETRPGV